MLSRKIVIIMVATSGIIVTLGLGLGLGLGLSLEKKDTAAIWQPEVGATWQITLLDPLIIDDLSNPNLTPDVEIYDFDLYDNTDGGNDSSVIDALHKAGKKVICYFSAGSYENWRSDESKFHESDLGDPLEDWEGERWLDLTSSNVHDIMKARIQVAADMGCDAIDPDNMDAYNNKGGGIGMTEQDSINYLKDVLAPAARSHGMAIGLKNADAIISSVLDDVQFSVNEQCSEFKECGDFAPFIEAGKPVFHIEYPKAAADGGDGISDVDVWCVEDPKGQDLTEFSTVIKKMNVDGWVEYCNKETYTTPIGWE